VDDCGLKSIRQQPRDQVRVLCRQLYVAIESTRDTSFNRSQTTG
jgi:hypothetical protein